MPIFIRCAHHPHHNTPPLHRILDGMAHIPYDIIVENLVKERIPMAKLLKKIQNKAHPKAAEVSTPPRKRGRDIFLLLMIGMVLSLLIFGWDLLPVFDRAMYGTLSVSLLLTYGMRQGNFKEPVQTYVTRASFVALAVSLALFSYTIYIRYLA